MLDVLWGKFLEIACQSSSLRRGEVSDFRRFFDGVPVFWLAAWRLREKRGIGKPPKDPWKNAEGVLPGGFEKFTYDFPSSE